MGLCKDCKWWKTTGPLHPVNDDYFDKYIPGMRRCLQAGKGGLTEPNNFYVGFGGRIDDETEARPILITGPEFGCNQFEREV